MKLHFSYILSIFIDHVCFADHEHVFLGEYLHIPHMYIYNTMLHFSAYHDIVCCSWERFVCNLHAYSACLQYMEDTGRSKMRQEFYSFRMF